LTTKLRHTPPLLCLLLLLLSSQAGLAQADFSAGILPKLTFTAPLPGPLQWAHTLESRQLLFDNSQSDAFRYQYVLTDYASILSIKIGPVAKAQLGYQIRYRGGAWFHRLIQRYTRTAYLGTLRLGHRIGLDQTFTREQGPTYRVRYRLSLDKPLSGDKVDPGEFYLKMGNEYLLALQEGQVEGEFRLLPQLGYEISPWQKVELGLDYRLGALFSGSSEQDLWLTLSWFGSLK
jgi:hypothetical protein